MWAKNSGDSTWEATSRRLRSFQAGSMLWKTAGVWYGVPTEAEAVAVCGLDAEAGVEALVDEGVLGPVEQLLDEDGRTRVG